MQFCKDCGGVLNLFGKDDRELCPACIQNRKPVAPAPPARPEKEASGDLLGDTVATLHEVFELAEKTREGAKEMAQESLRYFHPLLVVNRDSAGGRVNKVKLRKMVGKYLGIDIPELGDIPEDSQIDDALKAYLPICELYPSAPAALALTTIAEKLVKVTALFSPKASETDNNS